MLLAAFLSAATAFYLREPVDDGETVAARALVDSTEPSAPMVTFSIAPPATLFPAEHAGGLHYWADIVFDGKQVAAGKTVAVSGAWIGATGRRTALWPSERELEVAGATVTGARMRFECPLERTAEGVLRLEACMETEGEPKKACSQIYQSLTLARAKTSSESAPFYWPLALAALTILGGVLILRNKMGVRVDSIEWKIDRSFILNAAIGATVLTTLSSIGLNASSTFSQYTQAEILAWGSLYGLAATLGPLVFNLVAMPKKSGEPAGTLWGYLAGTLFVLFGGFGQLFLAWVLLGLLPGAGIISPQSATPLRGLPVALGLAVLIYAWNVFESLLDSLPEATANETRAKRVTLAVL